MRTGEKFDSQATIRRALIQSPFVAAAVAAKPVEAFLARDRFALLKQLSQSGFRQGVSGNESWRDKSGLQKP